MPALWQGAPCCKLSLEVQSGWLGFFLISFSDRRVLGEPGPDSTQSARDRQAIHNQPKSDLQRPQTTSLHPLRRLSNTQLLISRKPIHGEMLMRLAKPRPARLALQLEARLSQSTISSNVFRHSEHPVRCNAKLEAGKSLNFATRSAGSRETYQETSSTQWQKN
jgi:hypothetical protein